MVSNLSEIRSGLFIPDRDPDFLPTPDPGSGSATLSAAEDEIFEKLKLAHLRE